MAISDDYYARIRQIESGGNDNARNPSGASGRYQFMPATWKGMGLNAADIMNPDAQEKAIRTFTAQNYNALQKNLGREPEPWELYIAHQQGTGGALAALRGDRNAPVTRNMAANNPFGAKSQGEWLSAWQNKFNRGELPPSPAVTAAGEDTPATASQSPAAVTSNPYGRGYALDLAESLEMPVVYGNRNKERIPTFEEIYARFT